MPLSQRRDKLTFGHAQEIVGRTTPNQFPFWVNQIETKGLSIKALREELRKASSTYKPETNDGGTSSFLEIATQFSRDYLTACPAWSPKFRAEVLNILSPVLKEMGVRG